MQEQAQQRAKLHRFKGHFQIGQHIRRDVGCACDDARRACDHALGHVKDGHDDIERVGQDQDGTSGFEYPFVDIRHVELVHIVLFQYHLDQLIGGNEGQDQSGNRQYHRFGKLPYQGEHPGVPCRRGSPHLYGYFPDAGIHRVKQPLEVSHDALDQKPFEPFRDPFGENTHRQLSLKQGRQQRDQGRAQHDDAAARHELLDPLAFGRCVIRAVALQQIDHAPHGKASAQRHDESLQGSNGRSKKLHKSSISPGQGPGYEKSRHFWRQLILWPP